ncbi:MAG: CHAT domain-containing protein [Acidobacteriia bacterium]|nr:CHAT domain-containing protein [Terriglobia bacterium]
MSSAPAALPQELAWIGELSRTETPSARRKLLRKYRAQYSPQLVDRLYDEVVRLSRVELLRAAPVADAALAVAQQLRDQGALAQASRAVGHILLLSGKYKASLQRYQKALQIFQRLGRDLDAARTASGGMLQTLIYLGQYSRAFALAARARKIFRRRRDRLRLARLDSNLGNVLYRQDRFQEALGLYRRAYAYFRKAGETQDVAITLRNMAVCYISLNRFAEALKIYHQARRYCERHGLVLLVAEADYNIAYLHFLRGEYTTAIALYETTRQKCKEVADPYHRALCDLDQAEMFLELNLGESGTELAQAAYSGFFELHMHYEAAKALTFLGIAASQLGKPEPSLQRFDQARKLFVREKNRLWPALIDLYKALVLYQEGKRGESRRLAQSALRFFATSSLPAKAAICELLLAKLDLQAEKFGAAKKHCLSALRRLKNAEAPAVGYQAYFVLGQIREALKDLPGALRSYRQSHATLEDLRSHLLGEELKIAFLKDKLEVYESLVWATLLTRPGPQGAVSAFAYVEQAKSRSLADLIASRAHAMQPRTRRGAALGDQVKHVRDKLNWASRQILLEELRAEEGWRARIRRLSRQTRVLEGALTRALAQIRNSDREFVELQSGGTVGLDAIRSSLPQNSVLLEYYHARGVFYVWLVRKHSVEMVPLGPIEKVRDHLRLLQFQLSKFRFGRVFADAFSPALQAAASFHLNELYRELVAPIRDRLDAAHLVIVPHGFLHQLPFHALWDGRKWLCDEFSISYAPSASVFHLCAAKRSRAPERSLVLGIPDPRAPHIRQEAEFVASVLPNAALFLGEEASEERLRAYGPVSRFIHIATHGLFRRDNPMFSSIRLGNSQLTLLDLYQLRLSAELITLSGCGTGLNAVVGGDELLGLARGLLYAGAQALVVTLWDVNDESTAMFMKCFYEKLTCTTNKAVALQHAIHSLRSSYAHPYYWAPFVLIGKFA